jgi:hypothetical protein
MNFLLPQKTPKRWRTEIGIDYIVCVDAAHFGRAVRCLRE